MTGQIDYLEFISKHCCAICGKEHRGEHWTVPSSDGILRICRVCVARGAFRSAALLAARWAILKDQFEILKHLCNESPDEWPKLEKGK